MMLRTLKYLGNDIAVDPNLESCSLNDAEGVTAQKPGCAPWRTPGTEHARIAPWRGARGEQNV